MKNVIYFIVITLFCLPSNAQDFKLGKVSIAELEQKQHPKDTAAVAAILFKTGSTRFEYFQVDGFKAITEVAMRIKIYKKEGYAWANNEIRYISASTSKIKENVSFEDAVTYNIVAGKIEKTKLKSEGQFDEKVNRYWSKKKITLPNVKEGSVLEFRYTIITSNIGMLRDFDFQTDIPVDYAEYKTYVPEYFIYNTKIKGYITPQIKEEKSSKSFTITSKERTGGTGFSPTTTNFSTDKIDYLETKTTYVVKNMPAIKEEAFVNNIGNYITSVVQELSMTKYPNETLKLYSTDWEAVVKTIYNNEDFGAELNKTGYFENDLKAVVTSLTTPDEIILAILNHVRSFVKWNGYYGYSCDDGVKKAYKDKMGNVAEINLMLTAMLREAGLQANPVLLSTRSNGVALFPNHSAFNYVIAAVESNDGLILLDATSKFSTPNVLPFRDLNWMGRLVRKDGTSESVDLMPTKASGDYIVMNYVIDPSGKITGKMKRQRTDHNALSFRSEIESTKEEEYLEKLENKNANIEISEYARVNEKEVHLPIMETCSFTGSNLCELIGDKIYINPLLFFTYEQNPFKQEEREYPIDYGFPFKDRYTVDITIPDGFAVEVLPKSSQLTMEGNLGSFKFLSNSSGKRIQLSVSHEINASIVPSEYYSMLKDFYKGMIAKETEKIVLKKI